MASAFAVGEFVANILLRVLPRRFSDRIRSNASPREVYVLRANESRCDGVPRMTLFEAVFATILFDLALFGTSNPLINGIIRVFTSIQNSWDRPFRTKKEAAASVSDFCTNLSIQSDPWIWEKPPDKYASLNEFFSRTYAPASFPPLGDGFLVSPACCMLSVYRDEEGLKRLLIKGCEYDAGRIGLPQEDIDDYRRNHVLIGYLSPKDYHRVHAPIEGKCVHLKMEGANRQSASVKFFGGRFNILNENKRLVVVIESDGGEMRKKNRVALVIVGGVGVNTISYDQNLLGSKIRKGQDLASFRAGGSAFAMFSTRPFDIKDQILRASAKEMPVEVWVGESLG